jgi:DNA-directed RNA polymerase subunit H (RpoH/RPB5)
LSAVDYNASKYCWGCYLSAEETIEERKAQILIGLRGYKLVSKKKHKEGKSFLVKTGEGKKMLIYCWPTQGTVGVQAMGQVRKAMAELGVDRGILVTSGRLTQAAKQQAKGSTKRGPVELIPRIFPSFNIFAHMLVPKHEIVSAEDREKLLNEYRVQPYQLPRIRASDPGAKAIGAKPGDIVRIIRNSPTAGKYTSYRYVVEG